jgi:hypothetical protein
MVTCQEHLDLVAAVRPPVADDPDIRAVIGIGLSIPVIWGIRWSAAIKATGSSRRLSVLSAVKASGPEEARTMRYSAPYWPARSLVIAAETCGSSSTVKIVGRLMTSFPGHAA